MDKHKIKILQKKLGQRLMQARLKKNFTQLEVSITGIISQSHLSKVESGEILPNIFVLNELAKFYEITISELIE